IILGYKYKWINLPNDNIYKKPKYYNIQIYNLNHNLPFSPIIKYPKFILINNIFIKKLIWICNLNNCKHKNNWNANVCYKCHNIIHLDDTINYKRKDTDLFIVSWD